MVVVVVVVVVVVWFTQVFLRLAQVACFSALDAGCTFCFDLAYCVVCVCCDQLAPVQTCACPDTWCPSKNLGTGTNLNKFKFRQYIVTFSQAVEAPTPKLSPISP